VFSVDTEEEARTLIVMTCPSDDQGNHYARELVAEQTLENLQAFSDKLARAYQLLRERRSERTKKDPVTTAKIETETRSRPRRPKGAR
jgi:hypothetical protein